MLTTAMPSRSTAALRHTTTPTTRHTVCENISTGGCHPPPPRGCARPRSQRVGARTHVATTASSTSLCVRTTCRWQPPPQPPWWHEPHGAEHTLCVTNGTPSPKETTGPGRATVVCETVIPMARSRCGGCCPALSRARRVAAERTSNGGSSEPPTVGWHEYKSMSTVHGA